MPVSPLPILIPLLLVGIPLLLFVGGKRLYARRAVLASVTFVLLLYLRFYVPGWVLMWEAERGDPAAMYELARWTESRDNRLGQYLPWPLNPDLLRGYQRLERAAALDYPPAVYAIGVRLKYGEHVPRPVDYAGPGGGNVFCQPERGQALIDRAIRLGYRPQIEEPYFYWLEYRK